MFNVFVTFVDGSEYKLVEPVKKLRFDENGVELFFAKEDRSKSYNWNEANSIDFY